MPKHLGLIIGLVLLTGLWCLQASAGFFGFGFGFGSGGASSTCWTSTTPASLAYSPTSKVFGGVTLGSYSTVTLTLSNTGGSTAVSLSQSAIPTPFRSYSSTCGSSLASGANCTERLRFKPTQAKYSSATFTASWTGGSASATVSGTGLAAGASDNFTGTDATALSTHDANWAVNTGYGNHLLSNFAIYSNQLRALVNTSGGIYYSASSSDTSTVTVKALAVSNTTIKKGVLVRASASTLGYVCSLNKSSTDSTWTRLMVSKNNALTFVAQSSALTLPTDVDYTVTAWYTGGQIHCTATDGGSNNATVAATTDATVGAGSPGIFINGDANQTDAFFDTWRDN